MKVVTLFPWLVIAMSIAFAAGFCIAKDWQTTGGVCLGALILMVMAICAIAERESK